MSSLLITIFNISFIVQKFHYYLNQIICLHEILYASARIYSEMTRSITLTKLNDIIRAVKTRLRSVSDNATGP